MIIFLKKRLLPLGLACLMFLLSAPVSAQSTDTDMVEVTGVVTEASSGLPMAGVKVQAYNIARHSAMTKADGSFSIKVPKYVSSLTFSLEGCNTIVCALKGRVEDISVKMYSDAFSEIYEASTTASTVAESEVSNLSNDILIDGQIQQSLQGNILSVMRSGQLGVGALMQIDGINSLNINTQPLIVLDGIILDMGYEHVAMHDGFHNNLLANIPVEDIESVQVLKNGFGIYGAKAGQRNAPRYGRYLPLHGRRCHDSTGHPQGRT